MSVVFEIELSQVGKHTKKKFSFPELHEITVGRFVKFHEEVEINKPKTLTEYEGMTEEEDRKKFLEEVDQKEITDVWTDYIIDHVQFWTGLDDKMMELLSREQLSWIYKVMNITLNRYKPKGLEKFKFKNQTYHFPPAPQNTLLKQRDYMRGTRIVDVVEAFQFEKYAKLLSKSQWGALPYLMGILCRKYEEQLPIKSADREKFIADRKQLMEGVGLDVAFELSFFLLRQKPISTKYSLLYSLHQILTDQTQNKNRTGKPMVGT